MGRFDSLSKTIETVRAQSIAPGPLHSPMSASIPSPPPILMVSLSSVIRDPDQDRRYFDPLVIRNLSTSIQQVGLIDPLSVRPRSTQAILKYDLLAGEQRHRACELAGLTEIPVRVFEVGDDTAADIKSVSNLQRKDLNFWEEAVAIMKMLCRHLRCSEQQVIQLLTQKANIDRGKSQKTIDSDQWQIVEEVYELPLAATLS
jgi:ParB family transcriptional regulator, chromosome partitioning protein